jgi:F-type H+/Na+-transporting ATPase subunit alpha
MNQYQRQLDESLAELFRAADDALVQQRPYHPHIEEIGFVRTIGNGVTRVTGLPTVKAEELVYVADHVPALAFDLAPDEVGLVLLGGDTHLAAGDTVRRTGRVLATPVGTGLLGRVVDPLGRPLDGRGRVNSSERLPIEREATSIMDRSPVTVPLQTGVKVVDALIPVGRGQRELILGDRQTGKTALALDTIINQRETGVLCVYCAIGQRNAAVARVIADLRKYGALAYTIVVVAPSEDPPGVQYIAPYAATTMAEHLMEQGRDVLIVYDDLTHHARSYRELSLLLRRPPGREAYPGDIFYIHSRLLERSTHLRDELGGGSMTALPIVETQAQNLSAYIPTNLISITDGQIYLSPDLFQNGILPAVDVGRSVSRVGGKTQLAAYRAVAGDLRLAYAQFEELEAFARFGTRLDDETRHTLERGRRVRSVLQQPQYQPIPVPEQIAVLLAVSDGLFDHLPVERIRAVEQAVRHAVANQLPGICLRIGEGKPLSDADRAQLLRTARHAMGVVQHGEPRHGDA